MDTCVIVPIIGPQTFDVVENFVSISTKILLGT